MLCVWIFLTGLSVVVGQPYYTIASGYALENALAVNYSVSQRPAVTTDIDINFGVSHINVLDIVNQHLGIHGFLAICGPGSHGELLAVGSGSVMLLLIRMVNWPSILIHIMAEVAFATIVDFGSDGQLLAVGSGAALLATHHAELFTQDPRLTWTAASYDNMDELFLLRDALWTPPLVLFNAAKTMRILSDDSNTDEAPLKVSNTGSVTWLTPVTFEAVCTVFVSYYPFDKQECNIEVSTWFYSSSELNVTKGLDEIILDLYEEDGEWDLDRTEVTNTHKILHGFTMPMVRFTMHLNRKYMYYLMNMVLPVIFLAFLGTCVFILPASAGKTGFALTILLSLSVVMTMVSHSIPPTSTHISILSVYLLTTYILVTVEGLVTVVTLIIAEYHTQGYKLSPGFQRTIKNTLAPLSRYRRAKDKTSPDDKENVAGNAAGKPAVGEKGVPKSKVAALPLYETNKQKPTTPPAWTSEKQCPPADDAAVEDYTYADVAKMMDRINFVIFFVLTSVITVVLMLILRFGA